MRCFVTGAAGFIGSTLSETLLAEGHEVTGIDCFIDYYPRSIKEANLERPRSFDKFRFIEGNLLQLDLPQLFEGADWIFHLAAQAGVRASWGDEFSIYTNNNILASQRVLEAARDQRVQPSLKKIVYASSSSVYGHAETLPTLESMRPQPISPYGVSKLAAEHLMVLYQKEFSVPTMSVRYFTVYGPRQRPDMAFNRFIKAALRGEQIEIYGDGEQSRDFTFVADAVAATIGAAKCVETGLVCNVGGGSRARVNDVLKLIEEIVGSPLNINRVARQAGDAKHTAADTTLARKTIGFNPKYTLAEGLKAETAWMAEALNISR